MAFRLNYIIFVIYLFTFNISDLECKMKKTSKTSKIKNRTLNSAPAKAPELNLGISDVLTTANEVFGKIIGRMFANKRLVGLDSDWYW